MKFQKYALSYLFAEFLSYGLGHPSYCGNDCKFLSDGFGYWMNDTWIAHAPGKVFRSEVLLVRGRTSNEDSRTGNEIVLRSAWQRLNILRGVLITL